MITSTVIGTVTAFTNLTTYCMQLFLQKIIWLPRLLSQYTKVHTVTPPNLQYATYVPNQSSQISNQLLTTLTKLMVRTYLKHIIIIYGLNIPQLIAISNKPIRNHDLHISMLWQLIIYSSNSTTQLMDTT